MGEFGIGQSVPREEDPYLVRGAGRYVDDVTVTGQLRGFVLRSPHAHARKRRDGTPAVPASQPALARDIVHLAGDPVAFVAAETLHQAKDAAEAIEVDYEPLPAVANVEEAIKP